MEQHSNNKIRQRHHQTWLQHSSAYYNNNSIVNSTIQQGANPVDRSNNPRFINQAGNRASLSCRTSTDAGFYSSIMFLIPQEEWQWGLPRRQLDETTQSVPRSSSLQDGNNQGSIVYDKTECLPSFYRSIRYVPSHNKFLSGFQALRTSEIEKKPGVPILHNRLFWLGFKSFCLYQSMQTHFAAPTLTWNQDFRIFGRLAIDVSCISAR